MGAVTIALLAALTIRQTGYWRDTTTLFEHAVAVADCDYSRGNLAMALSKQGRYSEAEMNLEKAIQFAPADSGHHVNLAGILVRTGRLDDANIEADKAVQLAPTSAIAVETRGVISRRRGHYDDAVARFDQAAHLGFDQTIIATALNDTAASLASRNRPADAEPMIRKAVEFNPELVQARRNLVLVPGRPRPQRGSRPSSPASHPSHGAPTSIRRPDSRFRPLRFHQISVKLFTLVLY